MPRYLVVVDGFSLLYRAFYGMPALSTSRGVPTNAVYGFATMLLRLLENKETDALVVVFDAPSRTFRHEADETYKANRPPCPDDLAIQIPVAQELLKALRLPMVMVSGVEADDVIGAIARRAGAAGWDVNIVTSDADALQLVDSHVRILSPRRGVDRGPDLMLMDEEAVRDRYGIPPFRLPHWKALAGDPSDNIPGVPGIGPKTASSLLQRFETLDQLYERLDEISAPAQRATLAENRDRAFLSLHLATLKTDVNLEIDLDHWRITGPDFAKVEELFTRLEFRSLLRRVLPSGRSAPQAALIAERSYRSLRAAELQRFVSDHSEPGVSRPAAIYLGDGPCLAVSPAPGIAGYLSAVEMEKASTFLEDPSIPKALHDGKMTINRLLAAGIRLEGVAADIAIASYLLNPGRGRHQLDEVIFERLGLDLRPARSQLSLFGDEPDEGASLCQRADAIGQVYDALSQRLGQEQMTPIFLDLEMPLVPVLAAMERRGVAIDAARLRKLGHDLGIQASLLEKEIHELAGYPFTINSPKQLQDVLFCKLRLATGKNGRAQSSTDADTLRSLAALHPLPGRVLKYRELATLKSAYADALPRLISVETGRLHTALNQTATTTGRLSSSDPNLQSIPIRTSMGREIRGAFIAPPGHRLLALEYSQIELRILAHVSGDRELCRALITGDDVHAHTAASLFGVSLANVTAEMRRRAESINFGLMYDMSGFGLASDLGISIADAEDYIKKYFDRFPGVRDYIASSIEQVRRQGYVTTLMGRRRYFDEIDSRNHPVRQMAERAAINAPIQGTAADIIKKAMIRVEAGLSASGLQSRMVLQVDDELLFEVPDEEAMEALEWARREMESVMTLDVPLIVGAQMGANWGEMTPVARDGLVV